MEEADKTMKVEVEANTEKFKQAMQEIEQQSEKFGQAFSSMIKATVVEGKSLESQLKAIALRFSELALDVAMKPLEQAASNFFTSLMTSTTIPGQSGTATASTQGQLTSNPTVFRPRGQPAMAVSASSPAVSSQSRGEHATESGNAPERTVNVVFNINTPDVGGFRKSETQISTMLARAVGRGRRTL